MNKTAVTGSREAPVSQWCAVVDTRSGSVVHIHQFIPLDESELLPPDELAAQALEQTPSRHQRDHLGVVHPDRDAPVEREMRYSVDSGTGRLVSRPLERRRRPSQSI